VVSILIILLCCLRVFPNPFLLLTKSVDDVFAWNAALHLFFGNFSVASWTFTSLPTTVGGDVRSAPQLALGSLERPREFATTCPVLAGFLAVATVWNFRTLLSRSPSLSLAEKIKYLSAPSLFPLMSPFFQGRWT